VVSACLQVNAEILLVRFPILNAAGAGRTSRAIEIAPGTNVEGWVVSELVHLLLHMIEEVIEEVV
jgi:hypothetical protein